MPLNSIAIALKVLNAIVWTLIDNAKLLGFFTLSGTPSAICQQSQLAGAIGQTHLPNAHTIEEEHAIITVSLLVDSLVIGIFMVLLVGFFILTKAQILRNLGVPMFLMVSLIALAEPVAGSAIHVCNAKRHYVWNFLLSNVRVIALISILAAIHLSHRIINASSGIWIWFFCTLMAFLLGWVYLIQQSLVPRLKDLKLAEARNFEKNIRDHAVSLIVFRISILLFASLPSAFIAYMRTPREIGWFSFALTLSGFMYASIAPINEQIYSPSISRLVNRDHRKLLLRRLFQMTAITLLIGVVGSALLLTTGPAILVWIHKLAFLNSFEYLPALLLYQILLLLASGCSYALFCMNRFKALSGLYVVGVVAAAFWVLAFHQSTTQALWSLPFSSAVFSCLCFTYVLLLWRSRTPLLRRSMI